MMINSIGSKHHSSGGFISIGLSRDNAIFKNLSSDNSIANQSSLDWRIDPNWVFSRHGNVKDHSSGSPILTRFPLYNGVFQTQLSN